MKNIVVLIASCVISLCVQSQSDMVFREIITKEGKAKVNYYQNNPNIHPAPLKMYSWIESGEIHRTQGDYEGRLLHGEFVLKNKESKMIQKGYYKNGLKNGKWKTWNDKGLLTEVKNWKNGNLNGLVVSFVDGKTTHVNQFKKGKLQGNQFEVQEGELINVGRYKKGVLKTKEPKKFNIIKLKERIKNEKSEEPKEQEEKPSED